MTTRLLPGQSAPPRDGIRMLPGQDWPRLAPARVHEFCGGARRTLAALTMGGGTGPVIWIFPGWQAERLMPDGLSRLTDPGRIVFVAARRPEDLLWSMEEALRSGAAPLVVAELATPPGLTPVRRLHLAAEAGAAAGRAPEPPTGLILTPEAGGAAGVESRWRMEAAAHGGWRLSLLRARMIPPGDWSVIPGRGRITLERIAAEAPRSALPDPCGSP